ncbi:MAG: Ppx/GppA family phosphatase [Melioribacteraceae bacterium]|nr:Ppx/GppA family phosphatase [Melioribacteraceae bacterium]
MVLENLAAIDIGTNSFHLIVVKPTPDGGFEIIDREREVIRLNEGNKDDIKLLNDSAVERALNTLSTFKGIADSHNAEIRAVATSAVREARNKDEFIKRVHDETGISIEVVSGFEEARLIYLGILKAVPFFDKRILCIDIGGGSTEFLVGEKSDIIYSNSLKLGAVRLTQKFFPDGKTNKKSIEECSAWVKGEIFPVIKSIKHLGFGYIVGSSGTIQSFGSIYSAMNNNGSNEMKILNNLEIPYDDIYEIYSLIISKSKPAERKKIPGLEQKRADIIVSGAIILQSILESLNAGSITLSGFALREGIIIDTLKRKSGSSYNEYLYDIRMRSVMHLAESSDYDTKHCMRIANLAVDVFDQLKDVHKLGVEYREFLYSAALLHDIGYHISHNQHHKHSYYIIRNSNITGFTDLEISLIANVARYHRKSHPKKSHSEFSVLPAKYQQVVLKLAAILRIVDALDRTHSGNVGSLRCIIDRDRVNIQIDSENRPVDIELWSLERRKGLFEEVFGKKIEVTII